MVTRIKICGITRVEDARVAAAAGANAIGLVFCNSPRRIEYDRAQLIIKNTPHTLTKVALFQNNTESEIAQVLQKLKIDLLQFHGEEPPEFCRQFAVPYIKSVAMLEPVDFTEFVERYKDAKGILLDAIKFNESGGSGRQFDWSTVPHGISKPIIMAGGLTADNVADCIRQTRCYAVDVSSGVEVSKGIKDHRKIKSFIKNVRQVDKELRLHT